MQSVAVLNLMKCNNADTHVASNRIAMFLANELKCTLVDRAEKSHIRPRTVFFVNGPFGFCDFRQEAIALCERAEQIVWVGNDIAIDVPSQIKKIMVKKKIAHFVNHEDHKEMVNYNYVNWNALTYIKGLPLPQKKHGGIAYYGAFREDRKSDFEKYFKKPPYELWVSSSAKGIIGFRSINMHVKAFKMANLIRDFGIFKSTIYMEDEWSHKIYSSPANRFYECLSAGVLQFFDAECVGTFRQADIDISPWVVKDKEELALRISNEDNLQMYANSQREKLYNKRDYKQEMIDQLKAALNKTIL